MLKAMLQAMVNKRIWLCVLAAITCSACRADITVAIDAGVNGSGTLAVTAVLDKEAASRGPVVVDDLRRAGWTVEGPRTLKDGGARLAARHAFKSADDFSRLMVDVAGADGPFRDFRLTRHRSLLTTTSTFTGAVDLTRGLTNAFSDPDLRSRAELDPNDIQHATGVDVNQVVTFVVEAKVPGKREVWRPRAGQRVDLFVSSRSVNIDTVAIAVVLLIAVLAVVLVLARRRRQRAIGVLDTPPS